MALTKRQFIKRALQKFSEGRDFDALMDAALKTGAAGVIERYEDAIAEAEGQFVENLAAAFELEVPEEQ